MRAAPLSPPSRSGLPCPPDGIDDFISHPTPRVLEVVARAPGLLRATNVDMPHRVAEKFARSRIVAFSSGCVYPFVTPASGGAREDTPPSPVGDYAASCVARERAFTEVAAAHGTPVALIRLNYSIEFRYGLLVDIAQ